MISPKDVRLLLLDLDGTLYTEQGLIPGAKEAVTTLLARNIAIRFLTNTTTKNRRQLKKRLQSLGLDVSVDWFFTPARAAHRWFSEIPTEPKVFSLVTTALREDLEMFPQATEEEADIVLVGDMAEEWRVDLLHQALRCLRNGAKLTALQQNRNWLAHDGMRLDAGAYVAALEYAAGVSCDHVFGKPSRLFFEMSLRNAGVTAPEAMMVGDDLESDILAAQALGIDGAFVKTGKSVREGEVDLMKQAACVLDSIADLPDWLERSPQHDSSDPFGL